MMIINDVVFHCLHFYNHGGRHSTNLKNGQPLEWPAREKVAYRVS